MDTQSAYKILGLSEKATIEEIKGRYRKLAKKWHPDMPTGDANQFMLISTAFTFLNNNIMNFTGDSVPGEVLEAAALKTQVNKNFGAVYESYLAFRVNIKENTQKYIKQVISSADSSSDLKTILGKTPQTSPKFHRKIYNHLIINKL
jgi:DnaJ domain